MIFELIVDVLLTGCLYVLGVQEAITNGLAGNAGIYFALGYLMLDKMRRTSR